MGFFLSGLSFIEDRVLGYGGGAPGEGSSVRVVIRRGWGIGVRGKATRRGSSVRVVVRRGPRRLFPSRFSPSSFHLRLRLVFLAFLHFSLFFSFSFIFSFSPYNHASPETF